LQWKTFFWKIYFFLGKKKRPAEALFLALEKKDFAKKFWNGKREIAPN
jgi:hypothetical protein